MAIISVSRRTDIPAFFAEWFMKRIRQGHFYRVNPFNSKQVKRISLAPEDVDLFVFWSKNPRPLMGHLDELDQRGYRYYFQFTLNPYETEFEPQLPPLEERVATFQELASTIGPARVVWRYDPVILSSITPVSWHLENLQAIASQLEGKTNRLVFSFLDFYGKLNKRLERIAATHGAEVFDITARQHREELRQFLPGLKAVCDSHGIKCYSCAETVDLKEAEICQGGCIDGVLIRDLFNIHLQQTKDKNQRGECRCVQSVDMGMYNTCGFLCTYCYANLNQRMVMTNRAKHDPEAPTLVGTSVGPGHALSEEESLPRPHTQLTLF